MCNLQLLIVQNKMNQIWHSNHEEGKFISLIKEFIYKRAILNIDIKVRKGTMRALIFYF